MQRSGGNAIENIHLHAGTAPVSGAEHVRVVPPVEVLRFASDRIAGNPAAAVVVRLRVARRFVEP